MVLALMLALAASPVADVANLQFHSAFRPNLHHTLHAAGTPGGRPLDSPVKTSLTGSMTDAERRGWEAAVAYYAREISPKDVRTGAPAHSMLASAAPGYGGWAGAEMVPHEVS